jgi:hypothetical protein
MSEQKIQFCKITIADSFFKLNDLKILREKKKVKPSHCNTLNPPMQLYSSNKSLKLFTI